MAFIRDFFKKVFFHKVDENKEPDKIAVIGDDGELEYVKVSDLEVDVSTFSKNDDGLVPKPDDDDGDKVLADNGKWTEKGQLIKGIGSNSLVSRNAKESSSPDIISIGKNSDVDGNWGIAIGGDSESSGNIAIGHRAKAKGIGSTVIGRGAKTDDNYSIALGQNSKTTRIYEVSISSDPDDTDESRYLTGVKDPKKDTDAVNKKWAEENLGGGDGPDLSDYAKESWVEDKLDDYTKSDDLGGLATKDEDDLDIPEPDTYDHFNIKVGSETKKIESEDDLEFDEDIFELEDGVITLKMQETPDDYADLTKLDDIAERYFKDNERTDSDDNGEYYQINKDRISEGADYFQETPKDETPYTIFLRADNKGRGGKIIVKYEDDSEDELPLPEDANTATLITDSDKTIKEITGSDSGTSNRVKIYNLSIFEGKWGGHEFTYEKDGWGFQIEENILSDKRLKKDIEELDVPIEKILNIPTKRFKWKKNGKPDTGTIAQNLIQDFPELVTTDSEGYYRVNYGKLGIYTLSAVKGLYNDLDILKEEVEILKSKVK